MRPLRTLAEVLDRSAPEASSPEPPSAPPSRLDAAVEAALRVVEQEARANPIAAMALRRHPARARSITRRALLAALELLGPENLGR